MYICIQHASFQHTFTFYFGSLLVCHCLILNEVYTCASAYTIMFYYFFTLFCYRLKMSLDAPESRVHFALVCGAKSCPPIKTYSAEVYIDIKVSAI